MLNYVKKKYWDYAREKQLEARLRSPENQSFAEYIKLEKQRVLALASGGITDEVIERLELAVEWILLAQKATKDTGVSLGYFPLSEHAGWMPSYPETTGYIITSLLQYADAYDREEIARAALEMADWEIVVQMASGAVQGGPVCAPEKQTAAAFNTGMVADGWMSAYEYTGEEKYLQAARRAAQFLADDLDGAGFFRTNGKFVRAGEVKTYTCLCAWAMYRAALASDDSNLKDAAVRSIEAALRQRNEAGWMKNNCLTDSNAPLTHTIGYALQGIFEVGVLADRQDFIEAARQSLAGALSSLHDNGFLSGRLDSEWKPRVDYVCLTGSVQLAILCFRFAQQFDNNEFLAAGKKLTNFVKATQRVQSSDPSTLGGIAGSFPMLGDYMQGGYPNWATKYYIDALMLQRHWL